MDRGARRIRTLQHTLQASAGSDPWHLPGKPAGMHWTTYERLASQLRSEIERREDMFADQLAVLTGEVDRLLAQREYLRP